MSARLAVIVGAGGVLGAALSREFLAAGYDVVGVRREVSPVDAGVRIVGCDLESAAQTRIAVAGILAESDGVDVLVCNAALPGMLRRRRGVMLFSGATASLRGSAGFAALATAKFALRGLTQSLAREYQSQGIHVAHIVIDGRLDGSASAERAGITGHRALDAAKVANAYRWIAEQPPSAWTHELDLRPTTEKF